MNLKYQNRSTDKKSDVNKLRRNGFIPSVIYSRGQNSSAIAVESNQFSSLLRQVQPGRLATTVFTMVDEKGKQRRTILKDIQYELTTYKVIHLDFGELLDDHEVNVKVPIECIGGAECPGVKLGGVLRQVIRTLRVRCLPKDIPAVFLLDVRELNNRESRRLKDLSIPETVRPLANMNEVAVVIAKR